MRDFPPNTRIIGGRSDQGYSSDDSYIPGRLNVLLDFDNIITRVYYDSKYDV
jgi:hypothetical protein